MLCRPCNSSDNDKNNGIFCRKREIRTETTNDVSEFHVTPVDGNCVLFLKFGVHMRYGDSLDKTVE